MDPVNKLYCFDWIFLISAEYVVYIMCAIYVDCRFVLCVFLFVLFKNIFYSLVIKIFQPY